MEEEKVINEEPKEEVKEKKSFITWIKEHPKTVFITRLILWITFAAVLPFLFIALRYGIFTNQSQFKLTGWGFIAIIIILVFVGTLVKYLCKGLKPGLAKQCVVGFVKIILPLSALFLLTKSIEDSIHLFNQALGCVILCELVSIPLNPFPAWIEKINKDNEEKKVESLSDIIWQKFFDKKDKEK